MIEFFTKHYMDHSQGLNRYSSELLLRDSELYNSRNCKVEGGIIYNRPGYRKIGPVLKTNLTTRDPNGDIVLTKVGSTCTLTSDTPWKKIPEAGDTIEMTGWDEATNNASFTVTSATATTIIFTSATAVAETEAMASCFIYLYENIETLFEYVNSDNASYLLAVGDSGGMFAMLARPEKVFTIEEGLVSGVEVFTAGKTYRYAIFNVDLDERTSQLGEIVSITPTTNRQEMDLSNIAPAPPNVYARYICRTTGDGGVFYWRSGETFIDNDGTTTYNDTYTDAAYAAGTAINPGAFFTLNDWAPIANYHTQHVKLDLTRKTNFVMHKEWAIVMNGVDRLKWRAPKRLASIESDENDGGTWTYSIVSQDEYLEYDWPIGMKIAEFDSTTPITGGDTLILDNEPSLRRIKYRKYLSALPRLYALGIALPFGVPYVEAFSNSSGVAGGAGGALDGDYNYRITCLNANNSEGPDRHTSDIGDPTPGNQRVPGDSDTVTVSSKKITMTAIPSAKTTRFSGRGAGANLTITNPGGGARMLIERSANWEFLPWSNGTNDGMEIEISGSGLNAGNVGKFAVRAQYTLPTLTVIEVYNTAVVAEGPINCDVAFIEVIDKVVSRKLYRTGGTGAQPHREVKRDTAPAGLDAGVSYVTLPDASVTTSFTDGVADADLALPVYTYYDLEKGQVPIPINDDPPRFLYADSKDNMLVAANMNFEGQGFNYKEQGSLCLMVFNYGEVEGAEVSRFTPVGFGNNDSTQAKGIKTLNDSVIAFTEKKAYRFENLLELDFGVAPKREIIAGASGCRDFRSIQSIDADDGTQLLVYMGLNGLYQISESGVTTPLGDLPVHKMLNIYKVALIGERGKSQDNMPSCVNEKDNLYIVALKYESDSVNDLLIVYDFKNRAFWLWNNYNPVDMCYWGEKIIHSVGGQAFWEQNKGRATDYSDNGSAIEAYVESIPYHMGQPDQVKKWHKSNVYQGESSIDQILSIATRSNYGSVRTNLGRGETALPWGYTNRSLSVDTVQLSVTYQGDNVWRYTRTGGAAFDFVAAGLIAEDRIRIIDSSPFLNENTGDFVVQAVAATYFDVSNEWGYPEATVTLTAANQLIGYYPTDPPDEMDGIDTLFKNLVFTGVRDPYEVLLAPSSSKFLNLRFESFLNNKKMALAGWSIRYGFTNARGNERGGNDD